MVDFGESDKMIKKVDNSNTYKGISGNISFFITRKSFLRFSTLSISSIAKM